MYRYEIKENNVVEVFSEGSDVPFLRQPTYPNGDSFDSFEEAEGWANMLLIHLNDKTQPTAPIGKNIPGEIIKTAEELLQELLDIAASYGDNVPTSIQEEIEFFQQQLST